MPTTRTLVRTHLVLSGILAVLVLVMAVIAGRSLFGTWDIVIHGYVGNAVFLLVLANLSVVLAVRATKSAIVVAALTVFAVFAQIGLGYVGREQLEAASWHIPNGVLIMALAAYQFAGAQRLGGQDGPAGHRGLDAAD